MLSVLRRVALASLVGLWPATGAAAPLSVDEVVRSALTRDPRTVASEAAVEAARADRREVAVFLDNPEAEVGVGVVGGLFEASVSQDVSLGGEGWYARRAAFAGIDAATADGRRTVQTVAADARRLLAGAIAAEQRAKVTSEVLDQTRRWRASIEARALAGEVGGLDARLARLAEADAAASAIAARRAHEEARTALAAIAPDTADVDLPADPAVAVPAPTGSGARSDLLALDAAVRAAESRVGRARADAVPTLGLGVFAERDDADARFDLGPQVSVEVPLWTFGQGDVARSRADLATRIAERDLLAARVDAEQARTADVAGWAGGVVLALGDVEEDARAALSAIEVAWTSGEIGLSEAFVVRREVLAGWIASIDAREASALASLDALLAHEDRALVPGEVTP